MASKSLILQALSYASFRLCSPVQAFLAAFPPKADGATTSRNRAPGVRFRPKPPISSSTESRFSTNMKPSACSRSHACAQLTNSGLSVGKLSRLDLQDVDALGDDGARVVDDLVSVSSLQRL